MSLTKEEIETRKRETLRELASVFRELRTELIRAIKEKNGSPTH